MKGILAILMAGIMIAAMIAPAMSEDASTSVSVGNDAPDVVITSIAPDPADPGDTVTVNGTLSDPNGIGDVNELTYDVKYPNGTTCESGSILSIVSPWSLNFDLPAGVSAPSGTWNVSVTATDMGSATDTDASTFEVSTVIAITVGDMSYGSVNAGSNGNPGSHNVENTGTVAIVFGESSTTGYDNDADDGISWADMTFGTNTIADSHIITNWVVSTQIVAGASADVNFELDVPAGTLSGTYAGTTTFTPTVV
ncbi:MAG: hypothetical protein EF813_06400 [Methanosarcinales archaeon]|nr:MAG: hypothetical protein EF813_06400 [Methanosarcinales archaeon]